MTIVKSILLGSASLASCILCENANANSQVEAENNVSGASSSDIIVTARRRDEALQDVPASVNAVTAKAIEDLNLRRLEDITAVVPGLTMNGVKTSGGSVTTLRGVAYNSGVSGNNSTVEYYFNDGLVNSGAATIALFDIGQIEVLRGPQGTLRGRSTPSGSINIVTRRPNLSEPGVDMVATVNDIGGYNINGAINVPIIQDKLGIRIAGLTAEDDADRIHALNGTVDPRSRSRGIRTSVSANPFDDILRLDFTFQNVTRDQRNYDQVESMSEVVSGAALSPITIRARERLGTPGLAATQSINYDIYNGQAQLNLFGQSLNYIYSHVKGLFNQTDPLDKANVFAVDAAPDGQIFEDATQTLQDNTSHEIRLQNQDRVAGIFDYIVGAFFYDTTADTPILRRTGVGVLTPTPVLTRITTSSQFRDSNAKENSLFGNLTAHLGDRTEISGGIRRIDYKINSGIAVNGVDQPLLRQRDHTKHTIYLASIKHNFTDDLMAYASVGTSYRPPNVVIGGPTAPSALQQSFLKIDAETSDSYEIGVKSSWFDNRLRFNVTGFYQKFKNYPYRAPAPVFAIDRARNAVVGFQYVASVPVTVKGVEVEFSADPMEGLTLSGTVSYADGKIKNGTIPCLDLNGDSIPDAVTAAPTFAQLEAAVGTDNISACLLNGPANTAPRWNGTLVSEYTRPVSGNLDGYVRGLLSWSGGTQNDPVNANDSVKGYGLLNLYLGLRSSDGAWDISAYGKNITNTFRVLTRSNGPRATVISGPGTQSFTNYFGIATTPEREFGVNLRVRFGSER